MGTPLGQTQTHGNVDGQAGASVLVACPTSLQQGDELHLAAQTDTAGRTISQEAFDLTPGLNDLLVRGLNNLKPGLYLLRVTLPTGEIRNLKLVKH